MFVKALATNKKFSNFFFWGGGNELNIEKKFGLIPRLKKSKFYEKNCQN